MSRTPQSMLVLGLVLILCAWQASVASAQERTMETISEVIDVKVTTGTVVYRAGNTVVVNITEGSLQGLQKFVLGSKAQITRNGVPAQASDIRKGDKLVQTVITTRRAPVRITMRELELMMEEEEAPEVTPAVAPEPVAAPAAETIPAALPKTASALPTLLLVGLTMSLCGVAILWRRRFAG